MQGALKIQKTKKKLKIDYNFFLLLPFLILLVVLIIFPMMSIVLYSVLDQTSQLPIYTFTFQNYINFFSTSELVGSLGKSLWFALLTTIGCIAIGYPISYFIAKRKLKTQATLILLITSPMWINMLLRTLAVKQLFEGPLLKLVQQINPNIISILGTDFAVVFGMVYNYLPFMILPIYTILSKLDFKLIEASTDLGASRFQSFRRVILPLSLVGVLSGITIVFLSSATTIVISKFLGESKYVLIGNIIDMEFVTNAQWGSGSAISVILLLVIMILMWITNKLDKTAKDGDVQ